METFELDSKLAMMRPSSPHALDLGESQPPNNCHAVSVSLPTWLSVTSWSRREEWVVKQMKSGYPRPFINHIVQALSRAVLERLPHKGFECMMFPSFQAAQRLLLALRKVAPAITVHHMQFQSTSESDPLDAYWSSFDAVLYPSDFYLQALAFWRETGDGISSRHAQFCLDRFSKLRSSIPSERKPPLASTSTMTHHRTIKKRIATLASSEDPSQPAVTPDDVYLYPKGLCAIFAVARALVPQEAGDTPSEVVIYGWPYAETPKAIQRSGWDVVTIFGHGSKVELDELESSLAGGKQIQALFCEFPSNPQLDSPDLHRIRQLADRYKFIVACDETVGTFVNVDILPYVDIAMTSLTKIFSGKSDVMGGSVVINSRSHFYNSIHRKLALAWEDTFFPSDVALVAENSTDFVERVRFCSRSAQAIATMLSNHPSVSHVYYPSLVPSKSLYDRCRRPGEGYGYLLSVIFKQPLHAVAFYDALDVCKGPSIGTNFTISIPYAQLAHFWESDEAESHGVARHIVRISVGIDDELKLQARVATALAAVESTVVENQMMDAKLLRDLNLS